MTETDSTQTAAQHDTEPLYMYGIVTADTEMPPELIGVDEGGVELITHGSLAAVVTGLGPDHDIGTPDNLLAHSNVLDAIAARTSVLPMAFGTVIPPEADIVETVLEPSAEDHLASLGRLDGTAQFTVRARYLRDEVLADLVEEDPEVGRLRSIIEGTTEDETREARIQLGQRVVHAFDRTRPNHTEQIISALDPTVEDMKERDVGQVEDVVELAVLVSRNQVPLARCRS